MSERAIAYVRERNLVDPDAARVLLLLAGRTDALSIEDHGHRWDCCSVTATSPLWLPP
jgi:hypothetical protein